MKLNKTRIRAMIRSRILQEIAANTPLPRQEQIEDIDATAAIKKELLATAKLFEKGCAPGVGLSRDMTRKAARELADKLYEATEGGFLDMGFGTNEAAVQAVFQDTRIGCLADLSYIAHMYEKNYPGYTIASTLAGEYGYFSSTVFRKNVRDPLEDMLADDPIFILGDIKYDAAKIAKMKEDAKTVISDSYEMLGGRDASERALDAGKGLASVAGVSTALYGAAGVAGFYTAPGVMLSILGGAGGWGAATGLAGAALEGGMIATGGGGALAAAAAGIGAAIPGPGWIALGVLAIGTGLFYAFDEADFTLQEESIMSPDLYHKLNKIFKEQSDICKKNAEAAFIPLPPEEIEEPEEPEVTYPPLPADINGLGNNNRECVRRYQSVMNYYSASRQLGFPAIAVDGKHGSETRGMWSNFVRHVFQTHSTFSTLSIAAVVSSGQVTRWEDIYSSLVSTYPGYTKTRCGCLSFCLDAYYDNVYFGTLQPADDIDNDIDSREIDDSGPIQKNKREEGGQSQKDDQNDRQGRRNSTVDLGSSSGLLGAKDIDIGVVFPNNVIDKLKIADEAATRLKNASKLTDVFPEFAPILKQSLLDNMREKDGFSGRSGRSVSSNTNFELILKVDKKGMIKASKLPGASVFGTRFGRHFANLPKRVEQMFNNKFSKAERKVFDKMEMNIRLPMGTYGLNENKVVRKLIRRAIAKQILG